jgi:ATP phosphoribosyltransferase
MILTDDEIKERIESPINLLNRLRRISPSSGALIPRSGSIGKPNHPSMPPKAEDLVGDLEEKLQNSSARTKAMRLMSSAMDELEKRLPEVQKPERLAQIAREMSAVISHQDQKNNNTANIGSQIIVYAPQIQPLESFEIIDIVE